MNYSISIPQYLPRYIVRFFIGAIVLLSTLNSSFAQTDTEFWFVVPDITYGHNSPGGVPAALKFSSSTLPATVTISMPAGNPAIFPDIIVELAPFDFQVVSLNSWIVQTGGDIVPTQLENKALTPDGINNFGLHITSTAPITAYYEVNNYNNKDIWALKGRNGLGTEFFTPFQNVSNNGSYTPQPISAIDIVATQDGTNVTFTLPPGKGASYGLGPKTNIAATPAGSLFTVTLNRGQTFSLFPLNRSQAAADRLAGTKIESTQPIAVTIKDDSHTHLGYGCRDVSGDQLIPTKIYDASTFSFNDLIGKEYIAIRTALYDQDNLFILPVEDGTNIRVFNPAGTEVTNVTHNARQQLFQPLPVDTAYYRIVANKPVYVMHIGGFGCEVGAAILPPIEKCTGVPRVAFARTSTEDFYIVIMVRRGAEDGFEFNGAKRDDIFPPVAFTPVNGTDWSVARFGPIKIDDAAVGTHFMRNTKDIFHLGIVNGGGGTGCFYGYFSDYNEFNPKTLVIETGSSGGRICSGETLNLYASGGTTYDWDPVTYLDDPTSETPTAINVESSINYTVTISGACNETEIRHVNLQVGGPVTAAFDADNYTGCAVPATAGGIPEFTFNFTSSSTGDFKRWWSWQLGATGTSTEFMYGDDNLANDARTVSLTLENDTDEILEYHIKLATSDKDEFCFREVTKIIRVYPYIDISASRTIVGNPDCQPLTVNFTSTPIGNPDGPSYKWVFGDGNSAATQHATNTYYNTAPPYNPINYTAEVTITDKWNVCTATDNVLVRVPPYLEAGFTANPVEGCSPLQVTNFSNTSKGAGSYSWKLYRLGAPDVEVGSSITGSPPDISSASTLLVNNRTDNLEEVYRLDLEVTNASGCLKTYSQEFTVYPNPTATVSIDDPGAPDINCSPLQIDLSASTIRNTNSFQWLVDGVSRLSNPDPIGSPPPDYTGSLTLENFSNAPTPKVVSYKATNIWGCEFVSTPLNVDVQPHIHSEIVLDPEVICPDSETGEFDVQILDANIVADGQYEWFIDGESQGINTDIGTRTFDYNTLTKNANGEAFINLELVVENAAGCTKTDNQQIKVNPQVSVDFDAYIGASLITPGAGGTGTTLCPPETLDFTSSTTYANSYQWKFGSLKEATTQNASLNVENNGSSAFDLPVTLTASNSYGCSGTVTKTYTIYPEVNANFDIETLASCVSTANPFNLEVSAPSIANVSYSWSFNTQTQTGTNPTFTAITENKSGVSQPYPIVLTATGPGGCTAVNSSKSVTIYPEVQARWTGDLTERCAPADINLTNNSNLFAAASPSVTNIQWQVFDGPTLVTSSSAQSFTPTLPNTSHTAQKTYDVHLTATSADGCVGQIDNQIIVNPNPLARFNASITDACTPLVLDVVNESVTTVGSIYTWDWDNESSVSSSGQDHTVTYNNSTETIDSKHISLNIENEYGCQSDYDYLFEVFPQVNANLSITRLAPNENCGDEEFTFTNNSTAGSSIAYYEWSFGTDKLVTTSTADFNRSFTAHGTEPLDIPVSVRAFSSIGCTNATPAEQTITVFPQVVAAQSFDIGDICDGDVDLTLANASSNVGTSHADATTDFLWTFTPSTADGTLTTSSGANVNLTNGGDITPVVYDVGFVAETKWNYNGINRTCRDAITGNSVTVYPNLDLTFDIPDAECSTPTGVELVFAKNIPSSSGGDVNDISIAWDFGDGNTTTSNFENVTHTFTNISNEPFITATNFIATQLATGCTFEDNIPVTVYPTVTAAQSFTLGNLCGGTVEVTLANASSNTGVTTGTNNFEWRFTPDDLTNGAQANFTSEGNYSLVNNGSIDPVTYSLEFFAETVWDDGNVCYQTIPGQSVTVYPNLNPIYNTPPAICAGLTGADLEFVKNASSSGGGVNDVSLQWDFSDGNTRTTTFDPSVTKRFTNLSDEDFVTKTKFFATQLATGCTYEDSVDVRVHPKVESIFTFELGDVCEYPLPVTFANASKYSKAQTGVPTEFIWDYGYQRNGNPEGETLAPINGLNHTYAFYNDEPNQIQEYIVSLIITQYHEISDKTCDDSTSKKIQVYPELLPEFNLPTTEGCNPLTVSFENNSTGVNLIKPDGTTAWNGQFIWNLDDGTTSSSFEPTPRVYKHTDKTQSHHYDISLTATNPLGCVKEATTTTPQVTVYPWVESSFTVDKIEGCTPLDVTLSNTFKSDEYAYLWNFVENGTNASTNSSDLEEPGTITFTNPLGATDELLVQKPQIQLKTSLDPNKYSYQTDEAGCVKTATPIEVSVFPHVYPDFEATLEGCHPLEDVEFTNTSNVFGETNNGEYTWDFDNGVQSNVLDPTQTFRNPDFVKDTTFNVKLTAESQHGCIDDTIKTVTVYPKPKARIELEEYMGCSPFDLAITNSSVGKGWGSTLEFTFDFGDASDPYVTTDPADPASANHEYRNLNNEIEPYTLWLTVETENECTDETSQTIHVYPEVTARFDTEEQVYEQCNPFEVQFENTSTNSWSYLWNFDDGGITSSSVAPNYRFVNNDINDRTYDVTLTAMSEFDCEDTDTLAITVFAAPIVDFVIMPPHQVFPQDGTLPVVYFKNLSRPKGIPHTWPHKWTFGDGDSSISTEETIEHTYEHWGPKDEDFRYEVTLAISNEKCADTLSQKFTILPPEPISLFSANEYRACSPLEVNFYNESLFYLTDEDATAFEWRIDGEEEPFSTAFEPRWTFTEPGYYNVQLTVYGDGGEKHSYRTFRVYENPKASFEAMPERVTLPNARVHFYNFSERADSCIWVFGDNSFESNDWDPVHTYTEMGEYRVTLTAFSLNDDGTECVDIYSKFPAVWVLGSGRIRFPNAFVPSKLGSNGGVYDAIDYKNEVFHPVSEGVMEYRLQIFNRWGEQIFESNDINIGWDGYYKGKLASQGVYVWRAVGRFANGDMFDKRGNVTLLR